MPTPNLKKWLITFLTVTCLMFPTASLWSATNEIPQRADIEDVYKWNVEDIYPDLETPSSL